MRKWIFFQLTYSIFLWIATMIAFATGNEIVRIIASIIGILQLFITMFSVLIFTRDYSKDWFKTKFQLDKEIEENKESWKKANRLANIIGEHEAVKMWNEKKDLKPE